MDKFDMELRAMAKESKVEASHELREKVNDTCKKAKRNYHLKNIGKVAAVFVIGIFTLGFSFPAFAEQIPGLGVVVSYFNEQFGRVGYEDSVESINKSIVAGDYTINIESVYYDDVEMNLFYTVKSENPLDKDKKYWFDIRFDSNKKYFYEYSIEEGGLIDENTFAGMMTFNIKTNDESDMPDKFTSKARINNLFIGFGGEKVISVEDGDLNIEVTNKATSVKEYTVNIDAFEEAKIKKYPGRIILEYKWAEGVEPFDFSILDSNNEKLRFVMGDEKGGINIAQYIMTSNTNEISILLKDQTIKVKLD